LKKAARDIDAALDALGGGSESGSSGRPTSQTGSAINDGIIEAIKNEQRTPATIYEFLRRHLGIETSKHSVSTRLSKMKNDGLIAHDGEKWVLPQNAEGSCVDAREPSISSGSVTGRGKGFPSTPPEGSIPSGSTASRRTADEDGWESPIHRRPLTDEIPF
jgi:hypothetical protein